MKIQFCAPVLLLSSILGGFAGCGGVNRVGKSNSTNNAVANSTLITSCPGVPQDQADGFLGRWSAGPVRVSIYQGAFTATEEAEIIQALKAWNAHYTAVKGGPFFDYGSDSAPYKTQALPPSNFCSTSMVGNDGKLYGSVAIYKSTTGGINSGLFTANPSAMAITTTCTTDGQPYPKPFSNAMISINFINFFNPQKMPDMQSILAHEFGHLVGLDHSCGPGNGSAQYIGCNSPLPDAYKSALMYPIFNFVGAVGELRRNLRENDQIRSNCLYL